VRARLLAPTLGLLAVVSCAAAASSPSVRLVSAPRSVILGQTWTARLATTGAGTPVISARHASSVVKARGRRRVRLRLSVLGTWRVSATLAGKRFALGTVTVRPVPPYAIDNPAQVLPQADGTLLVAERGARNRILRIDPATGRLTVFATGIQAPFGLASAGDGILLVSSTSGLYRVAPGGRPTRIADVGVSPFTILPGGEIAYAHESSVGILPPGGGRPRILPTKVDFAHGLVLLPDGDLAISDTGNDRLLRVDPDTGAMTVIASGLQTPMGLALEPSGSLLLIEFDARRVVRVSPSGAQTTVAGGFRTPYALARAGDGTVYVTEAGELSRATGSLHRIAPDGTVTTVRLGR
jgi:streptogramin lyase